MLGLAIGSAALGMAGGIAKMISGGKQKREARRALRSFRRQQLRNVNEGRRISTRGAEVALEEQARMAATSLDALSSGGIRGVVGGVGAVNQQNNATSQQVGANLDQQQVQLDRDFALDSARMRQMKEQRDNQELNQLYSQLNAGQQNEMGGLGDIAQAGFGGASLGMSMQNGAGGEGGAVNAMQTTAPNPFAVNQSALMGLNFNPQSNPNMSSALINPLTGKPYGQ